MNKEKMRLLMGSIVLVAIGLLLWLGAKSLQEQDDEGWEQVLSSGVLRVGMDAAYPPFETINAEQQVEGFDVDLACEIGERLGVELEFVNIAYDGLYDSLLIGQVDVLISALVAAPQFEGKARFTTPYFNAGEFLVVRQDSLIREMDDLSGYTLAVEYGSGGDVEARQWERRVEDIAISRYPDPDTVIAVLANGEVDAALVDGISARLGVGQYPELILAENVVDNLYAVAVHRESTILYEKIDEVIQQMIADGTVEDLIEKWFGVQREY